MVSVHVPSRKVWVIFVLLSVAIALCGVVLWRTKSSTTSTQKMEVQVTASGFIPSDVIIKVGTQVVWKNVDAAPHSVASNPYPSNSSLPGLRSQTILPSGGYTFTPAKTGTIQYHDGTQPTHNGTIKVEK